MENRKRVQHIPMLILLTSMLLSVASNSRAQSQKQPSAEGNVTDDRQIIVCSFGYVARVKVEVRDRHWKEIKDLRKDDFTIFEDGVKQEICVWNNDAWIDRQADQAVHEVGYYPTNWHFKGELRKIRIFVRGQAKRKLYVQFSPKRYYAKEELLK